MQEHPTRLPVTVLSISTQQDHWFYVSQIEPDLKWLRQHDVLPQWHEHQLPAGDAAADELDEHVETASLILLLVSPTLLASAYLTGPEMYRMLQRHRRGEALVLPIMVSNCEWKQAPFGLLPFFVDEEGYFFNTRGMGIWGIRRALRKLLTQYDQDGFFNPFPPTGSEQADRASLLACLRTSLHDLLQDSLQVAAWFAVGLANRVEQVPIFSPCLSPVASRCEDPLPAEGSLLQVYEAARQSLLIVGEPGSGKSVLLSVLAGHLIEQAEQDPTNPLPVLLSLSSWVHERKPLYEWIREQLAHRYQVSEYRTMQWVQGEQIVLLLDGLDEVDEAARRACIEAINAYHCHGVRPLVVCSSSTENVAGSAHEQLALRCVVQMQPLSQKQVESILADGGPSLAALRAAYDKHQSLREQACRPLLLCLLLLTYQGVESYVWPQDASAGYAHLLAKFVERMLTRQGDSGLLVPHQMRASLSRIAYCMRVNQQSEFTLQAPPLYWLPSRLLRLCFVWSAALIFLLLSGVAPGLAFGLVTYAFETPKNFGLTIGGWILVWSFAMLMVLLFDWQEARKAVLNTIGSRLFPFWLWMSGIVPRHARWFLEEMRRRHLLQRVGRDYRFAHPILLDWFANQEPICAPLPGKATREVERANGARGRSSD